MTSASASSDIEEEEDAQPPWRRDGTVDWNSANHDYIAQGNRLPNAPEDELTVDFVRNFVNKAPVRFTLRDALNAFTDVYGIPGPSPMVTKYMKYCLALEVQARGSEIATDKGKGKPKGGANGLKAGGEVMGRPGHKGGAKGKKGSVSIVWEP